MHESPLFSIVIPTYNRSKYLKEAIASVIKQTVNRWELIIVDDASTDDTGEVVKAIADPRIIYLRNEKNLERGYSRNKGIEKASAPFICFLDSDDMFEEDHLQTFQSYLEQNRHFSGMLFCNCTLVEQETGISQKKHVPDFFKAADKFAYLLQYTPNPARVCVTADVFKDFVYDGSIPGLEDLDLWLHIATKFPIVHIHQFTSFYRTHSESYTAGDPKRYEKELRNFRKIFAKPALKEVLPARYTNRLLSMCYYHLSASYEACKQKREMYDSILRSFWLFPPGYNGRTNKVLLVRFAYNLPIIGGLLSKFIRILK